MREPEWNDDEIEQDLAFQSLPFPFQNFIIRKKGVRSRGSGSFSEITATLSARRNPVEPYFGTKAENEPIPLSLPNFERFLESEMNSECAFREQKSFCNGTLLELSLASEFIVLHILHTKKRQNLAGFQRFFS